MTRRSEQASRSKRAVLPRPGRIETLAILAGGALGTLIRAAVGEALGDAGGGWPWHTFIVNVAGAALLAWFTLVFAADPPHRRWRQQLLGTGLCGALTTFSTFQVELLKLARDGKPGLAVAYAAASLAAGVAAAVVVSALVRRRSSA